MTCLLFKQAAPTPTSPTGDLIDMCSPVHAYQAFGRSGCVVVWLLRDFQHFFVFLGHFPGWFAYITW